MPSLEPQFTYVISTSRHFERAFYEFLLGNLIYIYLLIMIAKRYIKNREIADLRKKKLTQSIKNKMFLISTLIIIDLLIIVSSFFWHGFWLYDLQYYSFTYIFQILVLIIEIRMMKFEFSKTIPYTWYLHHLFWILLTLLHLFYLLNTFLIECEEMTASCLFPNVIFDSLRLGISGLLTLYNLIFKFQDLPDFELIWSSNSRTLLSENNLVNLKLTEKVEDIEEINQQKDKKLRFKVNIKNKLVNNNNRVYFQINLELTPQKSIKLFKTIEDFVALDQRVQQNKDSSFLFTKDSPPLPRLNFQKPGPMGPVSSDFFLNQRGPFENYLRVFLENQLFPLEVLEFLEIKEPYKTRCIQSFHKKFLLKEETDPEKILINEEEKEERNMSVSSVVLTDNNDEDKLFMKNNETKKQVIETLFMKKRFCIYFNVQMKEWVKEKKNDYYSFIFQLSLVEKPDEMWKINKRYSDFIRLDQELKRFLQRNLPELPEKKLLLDSNILNKRGKKLAKYLRTLLNEKVYFNNILFEFIQLSNENYEILMNTRFQFKPKLHQAQIIDHTVIIDNEDKQPYTAYIVIIVKYKEYQNSDSTLRQVEKESRLIKRFSDFERLHKILAIRFGSLRNFPSFPSKLPSFSAGETIFYRKHALERYMNDLFKIDNIEDSVAFRKFLNFDAKERGNFVMNVSNVEKENEELLMNSEKL